MTYQIDGLFIGRPKKLTSSLLPIGRTIISSIQKESVTQITVLRDQILGDEVSNTKFHGGRDRVVHFYSSEHFATLANTFSQENLFVSGCFGENITCQGLNEKNVRIGDLYRIGECELLVTEARKPCATIDFSLNLKGVLKFILENGNTGWFCRVIRPGNIHINDKIELISTGPENFSLQEAFFNLYKKNILYLRELYAHEALSEGWKKNIEKMIN